MTKHIMPDSADARYGSLAMIKRLLLEQGLARWPQYAFAFTLMAVAANLIARVIEKHRWIAFIGLAVILYVAGSMIYHGVVDPEIGVKILIQ